MSMQFVFSKVEIAEENQILKKKITEKQMLNGGNICN